MSKTEDSLYGKLNPQVKAMVKAELLTAVAEEKIEHIRNKLVHAIGSVAAGLLVEGTYTQISSDQLSIGEYKELIPKMFEWVKSTSAQHKECALGIFNQLATHLMGKGLASFVDPLREVLAACLNDNAPTHKV